MLPPNSLVIFQEVIRDDSLGIPENSGRHLSGRHNGLRILRRTFISHCPLFGRGESKLRPRSRNVAKSFEIRLNIVKHRIEMFFRVRCFWSILDNRCTRRAESIFINRDARSLSNLPHIHSADFNDDTVDSIDHGDFNWASGTPFVFGAVRVWTRFYSFIRK